MASVDVGARRAICRSNARFAARSRYIETPVEATIAGLLASKPEASSSSHQDCPASKFTDTYRRRIRLGSLIFTHRICSISRAAAFDLIFRR